MRTLARILISGDSGPLQQQWNSSHPHNPMIAGAVCVDSGLPDYEELKQIYDRLSRFHPMVWDETSEPVYEEAELMRFEILTLWVTGEAGKGGNSNGPVYDEIRRCPSCKTVTVGRQLSPLLLDPEQVDESDFAVTDFGELVCSERFCRVFNREEAVCQPVVWTPNRRAVHDRRYQLVVNAHLGPLAHSFPLVREGICEVCGEFRRVGIDAPRFSEHRQLRFPQSSYRRQLIALTQERLGGTHKFPLIVVHQRLYRILHQQQMSGFWFEPAHLETT